MADVWDVGVASIDTNGNLTLSGGISYSADAVIVVANAELDTKKFTNLSEAYTAAKSLTPNGDALSATNRACIIIPVGVYDAGTSYLDLDTDFIDVVAQVPEIGGKVSENSVPLDPTFGYQPKTVIKGTGTKVVEQSANNIRLCGFAMINETSGMPPLVVSDLDGGSNSVYEKLYMKTLGYNGFAQWLANPTHLKDVAGTWYDCMAHNFAWRLGQVAGKDSRFTAKMYNCHAGYFSYAGDGDGDGSGTYGIYGAYFERCSGGKSSFASCELIGLPTDADTTFVECEGGSQCWSIGATFSGKLIRCRGSDLCAASWFAGSSNALFDGYAEDCVMGANSFGAGHATLATNSGHMVRCIVERDTLATANVAYQCVGATIEDSRITLDTTNIDALNLADGSTVLKGATIEVLAGGTGIPVNAGSAQNVVAVGCIFNNGANDANGLGANVTNLATNPTNGVY